ncbi:MAG: hypothetical protein FWF69_05400 [Firmicutes bacterium]|nr:hypothetical protein [Bacillota bacterium]
MKICKRIVGITILLAFVLAMFSGCGNNSESSQNLAEDEQALYDSSAVFSADYEKFESEILKLPDVVSVKVFKNSIKKYTNATLDVEINLFLKENHFTHIIFYLKKENVAKNNVGQYNDFLNHALTAAGIDSDDEIITSLTSDSEKKEHRGFFSETEIIDDAIIVTITPAK